MLVSSYCATELSSTIIIVSILLITNIVTIVITGRLSAIFIFIPGRLQHQNRVRKWN
jgi:hypothetical protein